MGLNVDNRPSINLVKGIPVNLTKENPKLKHILVGLGWDAKDKVNGYKYDLDVAVFVKARSGNEVVYWDNLKNFNGAIIHTGDNTTGEDNITLKDDEQILINLPKMLEGDNLCSTVEMYITVNIYDAENREQTFGYMSNAYVRVEDTDTSHEECRYNLTDDYTTATAIIVAKIYSDEKGNIHIDPMGKALRTDLQGLSNEIYQ